MCYLVAKGINSHGCYAWETNHGKHLAELKKELNKEVAQHGIQLITISRPEAYGEYEPYKIVNTEEDFVKAVLEMDSKRR